MRLVFALVLLIGVGLAGFAVYMAKGYVSATEQQLAAERAAREQAVPTVEVFVVNQQMRYGQRITKDDVRAVKWPQDAIPEGAFKTMEELFPKGDDALRSVLRTMEKDEAILALKVTAPGEDAGVGSRLGPGMRAFAIHVDVTSGVSGFLRPGDRVDVYWTGSPPGGGGEFTKLIDTNVRLIAVDQSADEDISDAVLARTVTVEATPQQVASLAQAQQSGRLWLSLVGVDDATVASAVQVDQRELLGIEATPAPAPVVQQQVCTVKTRRGADIVEVPIECTN
jgi:pilus assembly protein CpaB